MPEQNVVVNDFVEGHDRHFGWFRGVVTSIQQPRAASQEGQDAYAMPLYEPFALIAILGWSTLMFAPVGELTVLQHDTIPTSAVVA